MKNFTITTALLLTLLTPASAGFSFMGDMISDMREAAQEIKTEATDGARDMKDEMIDAKSSISDEIKDIKNEVTDNIKDKNSTEK